MENEYKETIEILSDKQLSKDIAIGIQQIKEDKLVDFDTFKADMNSKNASWNNLEKSLSEFTPDFMESGCNQPDLQKSVEGYNSEQETLYLCSIPGMKESLLEAAKEPLSESVEDVFDKE